MCLALYLFCLGREHCCAIYGKVVTVFVKDYGVLTFLLLVEGIATKLQLKDQCSQGHSRLPPFRMTTQHYGK